MQNTTNNLGILQRLKPSIPFSETLNAYIEQKFEALGLHKIVLFVEKEPYFYGEECTPKVAFERMKLDYVHKGAFFVWMGASENTIFGLPEINHKFRAIHDWFHLQNNLGFEGYDELLVNYIQQQAFSFDGLPEFECQLLNIETAGQILYYREHAKFPEDQRKFAIGELYKLYNYSKRPDRRPEFFCEAKTKWGI